MIPHQIHFVLSPGGESMIYGTRYLSPTNFRGSRLKYWRLNLSLDQIGPARVVNWDDSVDPRHPDQLAAALGEGWRVLEQFQASNAVQLIYGK